MTVVGQFFLIFFFSFFLRSLFEWIYDHDHLFFFCNSLYFSFLLVFSSLLFFFFCIFPFIFVWIHDHHHCSQIILLLLPLFLCDYYLYFSFYIFPLQLNSTTRNETFTDAIDVKKNDVSEERQRRRGGIHIWIRGNVNAVDYDVDKSLNINFCLKKIPTYLHMTSAKV